MHEMSIAQTIIQTALAEMKKHPTARLKTVRVVVGLQHAIVPENLRFAFDVLSRDTPAEGATLAIQTQPVAARCRCCGWTGAIQIPMYACGACGAGDMELTAGNELYLENLEVETDEPSHH
ncbi:MAG: hydrogenase maturation nickel metallochaperone HypA [Verrucomicrobia bacterium]|nr:hydrogenase maturation nickel metallochaperone HypA [Verrucomicrobiota bacterium]MBU4248462.1 hydrogenase maturation nickel metallochaperone HypA [Verrucomicrobiota bacterium]MBU4292104.1 hydrogenase maturation nickel metallochaperone HypA [Verrucomicrobiota bacterium]MBU4497483.1 hydrogenase maturation nickel metallochaperone HypA [Verrucomicrobiota bacterium]MCG2681079.1 hydrogenase maturation nickel metallochaperone HypA [Kiritimatiellia bacterium]